MRVGFIGLGNIGKPMAVNIGKGHAAGQLSLWVYDINPAASESFAKHGIDVAEQPGSYIADSDMVGLCVRNDDDCYSLLDAEDGLFAKAKKGCIFLVHATVKHATVLDLAAKAEAAGVVLVDAPMTGGADGAKNGTLCYMVGASDEVLAKISPVLELTSEKIVHAGPTGAGMTLKLCNNLMTYNAFIAMHEAYKLANAGGLSQEVLQSVGESNGVITPQMKQFIGSRDALMDACTPEEYKNIFESFALLGVKDLTSALDSAEQLGIELPATKNNVTLVEAAFYNDL